jgi:hypothetical protein
MGEESRFGILARQIGQALELRVIGDDDLERRDVHLLP